MKKKLLGISLASAAAFGMSNEELNQKIEALQAEVGALKSQQESQSESLIDEISNLKESIFAPTESYERVSSLGEAASKVYHSAGEVSIGGYGEYKYKKYTDFKNYADDTANETRRKSEWNIVRFVPYIGFKFSDWIIMNTEIEFEDGGARSDNTKNYKYAIVEFSYLDFMFDEKYALRVGHILTPMGLTNLNHEPVAFLTSERPTVETLIIPSTWHTNGALMYGKIDDFEYYAGVVTSPDAGRFVQGRFIQQGRLGARQFTDDLSFVARGEYAYGNGLDFGGSFLIGSSSVAKEDRPGTPTGNTEEADVTITMAEIHATYKNHGFNVQTLAAFGTLGGDTEKLPNSTPESTIPGSVNGQYLTVGYDLLHTLNTTHQLYAVVDVERLDMDADGETQYVDNNRFMEYSAGFAYFPDPKVTVKADYWTRDYGADAKLADESAFTTTIGFIF